MLTSFLANYFTEAKHTEGGGAGLQLCQYGKNDPDLLTMPGAAQQHGR